jgi:hypothetical protein
MTGDKQNFIAGVQQLISQDTLNTLLDLKAQGGTLGALSDGERETLQSAASKISTWVKRDAAGNVVGYNASEKDFKAELEKIKNITNQAIDKAGGRDVGSASKALDDFYIAHPEQRAFMDSLETTKNPKTNQPYTDEEKAEILGVTFNQGGSGTPIAANVSKIAAIPDGSKGGQCGRFVNQLTGLGVGDSYASKMAKMDPALKVPGPGMIFVTPYKNTGHIGIILAVNDGIATVKDSNYGLDERVRTHQIPITKITGLRRI